MKSIKYHCIKNYQGKFGTFYAGKIYTRIKRLDPKIWYVCYHEEDMIDYGTMSNNRLFDIVPGLKFSLSKENKNQLFFYDYFQDLKGTRKKKLEKLKDYTSQNQ